MNKHNLRIISVLVGLALVALIAIQVYWIRSSIKLKKEEFDHSVIEALKSTSYKLEKIATANKIAKKTWKKMTSIAPKTNHNAFFFPSL